MILLEKAHIDFTLTGTCGARQSLAFLATVATHVWLDHDIIVISAI